MALLPENYACLFIDATWKDFLHAFSYASSSSQERESLQRNLEGLFGGSEEWLVSYSVRTALDVFLTVMNFPVGAEVIFTAINIPDMVSVVEKHGLKVVPVDLDLDTLAPKAELIELAVTDKTVAILAAHLYGKWINLDKVFQVARSHGLYVLEDCAESFQGLKRKGHALSDLALFSFGSIKYNTSLGGALVRVKNPEILSKMRAKIAEFPVQSKWVYFKKLLRYSLIMTSGFNAPTVNWLAVNCVTMLGLDYKEYFISLLRAFPGSLNIKELRYQPSVMLLKFMLHRLTRVDAKDFRLIKLKGDFVRENMPSNVFVPGKDADIGSYWLFPVVVDDPDEVLKALAKEGVEAYRGATQLRTVFRTKQSENAPDQENRKLESLSKMEKPEGPLTHSFSGTELAAGIGVSSPSGASKLYESSSKSLNMNTTKLAAGIGVSSPSDASKSYESPNKSLNTSTTELFCAPPAASPDMQTSSADMLDKEKNDFLFPHNAKYLIDHVLYLPVHKRVPFWYLEHICVAVEKVMKERVGVKIKSDKGVLFRSKL